MKQRRSSHILFSAAAACFALIVSCADSAPSVTSAVHTLIYDYYSADEPPNVRLSVFASAESDIIRLSQMEVSAKESNLIWFIEDPEVITYSGKTYAGCSVLVFQYPSDIMNEQYAVSYIDAANRSDEILFSIEVPASFKNKDPASYSVSDIDARRVCTEFIHERIILYDAEGSVVYYGSKTSNLRDPALIRKTYKTAVTMRRYLLMPGNRAGILLPSSELPEYVPAGASDAENEQTASEEDVSRGSAQDSGPDGDEPNAADISDEQSPPPVRGSEFIEENREPPLPPVRGSEVSGEKNTPPPPPLRGSEQIDETREPPPPRSGKKR